MNGSESVEAHHTLTRRGKSLEFLGQNSMQMTVVSDSSLEPIPVSTGTGIKAPNFNTKKVIFIITPALLSFPLSQEVSQDRKEATAVSYV